MLTTITRCRTLGILLFLLLPLHLSSGWWHSWYGYYWGSYHYSSTAATVTIAMFLSCRVIALAVLLLGHQKYSIWLVCMDVTMDIWPPNFVSPYCCVVPSLLCCSLAICHVLYGLDKLDLASVWQQTTVHLSLYCHCWLHHYYHSTFNITAVPLLSSYNSEHKIGQLMHQ